MLYKTVILKLGHICEFSAMYALPPIRALAGPVFFGTGNFFALIFALISVGTNVVKRFL
jgi:hypothetical protein